MSKKATTKLTLSTEQEDRIKGEKKTKKTTTRYRQNRKTRSEQNTHAIASTGRNTEGVESAVWFLVQYFLQTFTAGISRADILRRRLAVLSKQPLRLQSRHAARGAIIRDVTAGLGAAA